MSNDDVRQAEEDEAALEAAKEEFELSDSAYSKQRTKALEDAKFEGGEHYTAEEKEYLRKTGRPEVIMDQTSGQVAKVTNQPVHRMIVRPNGGGADPKSAEYWQGICRRIEGLSDAENVYKWARRHAVVQGKGFWRVRHDRFGQMERRADGQYSLDVFQQDIRIEPILYQSAVYEDPRCKQLDFSDMRFCILVSDVEWSEFKRLHGETIKRPNGEEIKVEDVRGLQLAYGDCTSEWANDNTIRIAERYWLEDEKFTLCAIDTGQRDGFGQPVLQVVEKAPGVAYPQSQVKKEHTFTITHVKWMKYIHGVVLDRKDVAGRYVPVVKIVGERRIVDGEEDTRGMVRMAKTAQKHVNLYESRLASAIDLSSEGTWVGSARAFGSYLDEWQNAAKNRPGALIFDDVDDQGQPIAPPVWVEAAPNVQHRVMAAVRAGNNLRAALGTPDVSPEEPRREQSGVAIGRRQAEQAQATSHYGDATKSGVRHTCRIILSMGREIYDAPRIFRINGADDKEMTLVVAKGQPDQAALQRLGLPPGQQIEHMLDVSYGEFDATVTAGQVKETQRQETVDITQKILPMLPPPMAVKAVGTLLRNLDGPGMLELAQQLAPEGDSGMVPKEQVEQLKQQATQAVQQRDQKIAELQKTIDGEVVQNQSKERISKYETDAKLQMNRDELTMQLEMERVKQAEETRRAQIAAMAAPFQQPQASPEFGA